MEAKNDELHFAEMGMISESSLFCVKVLENHFLPTSTRHALGRAVFPCSAPKPSKMSASRTILDVPTILDPPSGGKKRRRDEESEDAEERADARSMARLISTVLSGPHPAPVAPEHDVGGADSVGSGGAASQGNDTTDTGGEEKSAGDKTAIGGQERKTAQPDRKAELRAQIASAKAENEAIDARRREVFGAYANLSSVYNYGLSHIAKLNDLSGAPDNTLPGNQPKTTSGDSKE